MKYFIYAFLFFGFVALIMFFFEFNTIYKLDKIGQKINAEIISIDTTSTTDHRSITYLARFNLEGTEFEVMNTYHSMENSFKIGDIVQVLYLPNDPYTSRFNTFKDKYAGIIFLLSISLIVLIGGFISLKYSSKISKFF